jgi:hypothetical protein
VTGPRYLRAPAIVWRDTGDHVVALKLGRGEEVLVLGGGAAHMWRLLEQPLPRDALAGTEGHHPLDPAVSGGALAAVEQLISLGLARLEGE